MPLRWDDTGGRQAHPKLRPWVSTHSGHVRGQRSRLPGCNRPAFSWTRGRASCKPRRQNLILRNWHRMICKGTGASEVPKCPCATQPFFRCLRRAKQMTDKGRHKTPAWSGTHPSRPRRKHRTACCMFQVQGRNGAAGRQVQVWLRYKSWARTAQTGSSSGVCYHCLLFAKDAPVWRFKGGGNAGNRSGSKRKTLDPKMRSFPRQPGSGGHTLWASGE